MPGILMLVVSTLVSATHHQRARPDFVGPPDNTIALSPFEPLVIEPRKPHWWQSFPPVSEPWRHSIDQLGLRGFRGTLDSDVGWRSTMGIPLLTITFDGP